MDQKTQTESYRTWKSWDRDSFGVETPESHLYYTRELVRSGVPARPGLSVLELGFGNGQFAAWCRGAGHAYAGTEIDPELIDRAGEAGFDTRLAPPDLASAWAPASFDLICAFDVLEHLTHDEILGVLGACHTLLRPGGRVIARFPSGDSPFSLGMQNGDMTHRSHIGRGMVLQFCLEAGLEPAQIRQPDLPILGLGPRRAVRRALVAAARWAVRGFVRKVFFDGAPRVVDPNMLVVLTRPA